MSQLFVVCNNSVRIDLQATSIKLGRFREDPFSRVWSTSYSRLCSSAAVAQVATQCANTNASAADMRAWSLTCHVTMNRARNVCLSRRSSSSPGAVSLCVLALTVDKACSCTSTLSDATTISTIGNCMSPCLITHRCVSADCHLRKKPCVGLFAVQLALTPEGCSMQS